MRISDWSSDVCSSDLVNIFQAPMLGMRRALEGVLPALETRSCVARIAGNHLPRPLPCPAEAWLGGAARDRSIMAASILAPLARHPSLPERPAAWPHSRSARPHSRAVLWRPFTS